MGTLLKVILILLLIGVAVAFWWIAIPVLAYLAINR